MTRSAGRRAGVLALLSALAVTAFGAFAAPGGAATTNPCKVLKKSEIQTAFGGTSQHNMERAGMRLAHTFGIWLDYGLPM